jgi:hypothetical protein
MEINKNRCQSCGMPIGVFNGQDNRGLNKAGQPSEYCKLCYDGGEFTNPDLTLGEMISISKHHMMKELGFDDHTANQMATTHIPKLKRWVVCE